LVKLLTKKNDIFWRPVELARKAFALSITFMLWLPLAHAQQIPGVRTPAGGGPQCQFIFSDRLQDVDLSRVDAWNSQSLSDPRNYDKDNFKFLLRATRTSQKLDEQDDLAIGTSLPVIFSSLVSSNNVKSFFDSAGIILKFDQSHVVGTSVEDTTYNFGSNGILPLQGREEAFMAYQARYPIQSPKAILEGTKNYWNNEVVLRGTNPAGKPVEIQAIFVYTDIDGKLTRKTQGNDLMLFRLAKKFRLPIVKFRAPFKRFDDAPLQPMRDPKTGKLSGFFMQQSFERREFDFADLETFGKTKRIEGVRVETRRTLFLGPEHYYPKEFVSLVKRDPSLIKEIESRREELITDPKCGDDCQYFFGEFLSRLKSSVHRVRLT